MVDRDKYGNYEEAYWRNKSSVLTLETHFVRQPLQKQILKSLKLKVNN